MSVKYSVSAMRNPQKPMLAKKFYAKAQARDIVNLNRIADEIAYATSLTDGDVLNVLRGLIKKLKEHLSDGDIVNLGDFGTFQYQISSTGAVTEKDFTVANIKKTRIRFRPGLMVKEGLFGLKFEKTLTIKDKMLNKNEEDDKTDVPEE